MWGQRLQTILNALDRLDSDEENKICVLWLHLDEAGYKFIKQIPRESQSLDQKIRFVNQSTGAKTSVHTPSTPSDTPVALPIGMGLFKFKGDRPLLARANDDLIRLFQNPKNYTEFSPHRKSNADTVDFVALFWATPNKVCSTLSEIMHLLSSYPGLLQLLETLYVPLLQRVLGISDSAFIMQAPTELIHYPRESKSGLEQHIDNVTRTGGVMGPVCSINFASSRFFDMLPSCCDGRPFRVQTDPGDLLVLDSVSRILWSHAVPYYGDDDRYSIVIRPLSDGSQFGAPIGWAESLGIPVYPPASASLNEARPPAKQEQIVNHQKQANIRRFVARGGDKDMERFWHREGIHDLVFKVNAGTGSSARDMSVALQRNALLVQFLGSDQRELSMWEVYGHDGADTLSFMFSFPQSVHLTTMTHDASRLRNLRENVADFRRRRHKSCPTVTVLEEGGFAVHACTISSTIDLLYVDPKWRERPEDPNEYNVLEQCRLIHSEVFGPCGDRIQFIQSICFKVRYDWPLFQCVLPVCELRGFSHVQTMRVAGRHKHHYFHLISRSDETCSKPIDPIVSLSSE